MDKCKTPTDPQLKAAKEAFGENLPESGPAVAH